MKISSVDVFKMASGNAGATRGEWSPVIVRVNTDEGISGFGEVGLAYGKGYRAGIGMVMDFAEVIIGENPMQIEKIWNKIFRNTFWGLGGGTVVSAAMSGIDIALWDIKGKAFGVPVYELLGGKTNDNLRVYASQIQYGWGTDNKGVALKKPEEYAQVTKKVISEGYDAVKVDPLVVPMSDDWNMRGKLSVEMLDAVYNRVAAIRDVDRNIDIIIELHANTDTTTALQIADIIKDFNIFFIEEPVHSLNPKLMREIREKTNIPLAGGERIFGRFGYKNFFENNSIQLIQPDICTCGGISEAKKICDMAFVYDCSVQAHVCGSPISKAAALQVEAVIPNFLIHEHHQRALDFVGRNTCKWDYQPLNGRYKIPNLPGIGQEPTEEAIRNSEIYTIKSKILYAL